MSTDLTLELINPTGEIANYVQAIWFARSHKRGETWLPSDGATGFIFPLTGLVAIDGEVLTHSVYMQSTATQSTKISYSATAQFCGVRFHPGGFAHLQHVQHPLTLPEELTTLAKKLQDRSDFLTFKSLLTPSLNTLVPHQSSTYYTQKLVKLLTAYVPLNEAYNQAPLSARQLERNMKQLCGITPKQLERIYRVRHAKKRLQANPRLALSQIAQECGYSDQSHFIREFGTILKITPAKYRKLIECPLNNKNGT
ncbi:AraC family transcriptional regulator [Pseudoalteromonas piscicida]|uniref:AraC family transcriptional regulator n=1 Tax=Pseudoalteromonas piscicida TaxID=43662 RepID=A0AAD0RIV5_PSEO7|nr:helix-turn-helix domain-containing protein [Pseudoalteromonas piscicida]ASD66811.1 AraC family transcriptional regulator [Pseudoalteromonas piscicida]AXR02474.1 AraC family transcriptional regulator [Pseudoalteromonas piscicida]